MKKKGTTTIILIVLIIGLVGSGLAFYIIEKDNANNTPTTTVASTVGSTATQSTTDITTQAVETTTQSVNTNVTGEISVNDVFRELDEYYKGSYDINCRNASDDMPIFIVTDSSNGKEYARVQVDLSTAIATETITSTKEVKEFSLLG